MTHRDLKPANVMVTKDGRVKVLDFGLAKLRDEMIEMDATVASAKPLTGRGQIVGTVTYMSPEQASGAAVDHRTDLFSLGVMLYELATGERPFRGDSSVSVLAAILKDTPTPVTTVRPDLPRDFARIVRRALAKDPEQRYQSAKDLRNDLQTLRDDLTSGDLSTVAAAAPPVSMGRPARGGTWLRAALLMGAGIGLALASLFVSGRIRRGGPVPVVRFDVPPPSGGAIERLSDIYNYVSVSPDGERIAFVASVDGQRDIWIKKLDQAKAEVVPGTRGALSPFWSPDGRWIAFFAGGELRKKSLDGGPPQTLCQAPASYNGSWATSGTILFDAWGLSKIQRVSQDGGAPEVVLTGPAEYHWPHVLPDGRHYLFNLMESKDNRYMPHAYVGALGSKDMTAIAGVTSRTEYVNGHLLYWNEGTLLAQPFDLETFRLSGVAIPLADTVHGFSITGWSAFATGGSRLLVYQAGKVANRMAWFDRQGREVESVGAPMNIFNMALSPDGFSVAVDAGDPQLGTSDLWIHDLKRGVTRHFTNDKGTENTPVWAPDGRTLVYGADRRGPPHLHARDVSGGDERQIVPAETGNAQDPSSFTPDGRWVIFSANDKSTATEIFMAPFDGSAPPTRLVRTTARASGGRVSPDGRWLAYLSDESGRAEVYVRPLRADHPVTQVSRAGGSNIRWRGDGRELFYAEGGLRIVSAEIPASSTFEAGAPRLVLTAPGPMVDYDVQAGGQRFLLVLLDREAAAGTISAILNWTMLLKKH